MPIVFFAIAFLSFTSVASAADRYWVTGGTGNWNSTTNWSDTSGGASGQSVPAASDNCIFDASSGSGTSTINATSNCLNLNLTSFTGTLTGTSALNIAGSLTLGAGMTNTYTGTITFTATSSQTITSNGIAFDSPITFNGVGGTWTLTDNLTTGATRTMTLTNGTFDTGGFDVSTGLFSMNNSNTRTLNLNDSTWTLTGTGTVWHTGSLTGLTLSAGTSTVLVHNTSTTQKNLSSSNALTSLPSERLNIIQTHPDTAGIVNIHAPASQLNIYHAGASAGLNFHNLATVVGNVNLTGFSGAINIGLFGIIGDLDLSQAVSVSSITTNAAWPVTIAGNLTLRADMPTSSLATLVLGHSSIPGTHTVISNGSQIIGGTITIADGTTRTLTDNFSAPNSALTLAANSVFDAAGNDVAVASITTSGTASDPRALTMGSGTWTLSGTGTIFNASTWTDFTLDGSTSTLIVSDTSTTGKTIALHEDAVGSFGTIQIPTTGNGTVTLSSIRADTLDIDSTEAESSVLMQALTINEFDTITAPDNYTLEFGGASTTKVENITGTGLTLTSQVDTQPWFINKPTAGTIALSNATIRDSWATPDETFHATDTSTDVSNNTGWCFGAVGSCASSSGGGGGGGGGSSGGVPTGHVSTEAIVDNAVRNALTPFTCLPGHLFSAVTGKPCSFVPGVSMTPTASTSANSSTTIITTRTLRQGIKGEDVRSLQKKINETGYTIALFGPGSPGNETSIFGTLTHMAVIKFQLANGLVGDGIVGPLTRAVLNK